MHHHLRLRVDHEEVAVFAVADASQAFECLIAGIRLRQRAALRQRRVLRHDAESDVRDVRKVVLTFLDARLARLPRCRHRDGEQRDEADDQRQPQFLRKTELVHPESSCERMKIA